jgi:hypothetical protein
VSGEAFLLGCWNHWHHAHRNGDLARHCIEFRDDGAGNGQHKLSQLQTFSGYLLSIYSAEPSMYRIPANSSSIFKELERAISIIHIDFFFFDGEVRSCYGSRCLSTVFAITEVTTWFCEEVVVDCYCDATAQTAACYGFFEGG